MKKISYLIIMIMMLLCLTTGVNAAASLSTNKSTVSVGGTFKTTVSLSGVAAWEVHVSSNGPAKNCSINSADTTSDAMNGSKSYSVTCTATGEGKVTIKLTGNTTTAEGVYQDISGTKTVTVTKKTVTNNNTQTQALSAVNNLKSLSIGDYELSPVFDPGTTSYNVTVPRGTSIVNILAETEHDKAIISGTGEKTVSEGMNSFEIIVTAENGAQKTYILNIDVEEDPIIVNMNKQDYTIVKQEQAMPEVSSYYSSIKLSYKYSLNGEEVIYELPAYYSEITKYNLLALKDEKGNIALYIYDEKNNKFTLYNEYNFGNIVLYNIPAPKNKTLKDMIKTTIVINNNELESYQFTEGSDYSLLYGINVNTGNEGWFMYDSEENTLQRYNIDDITKLIDKNNKYIMVVLLLSVICFFMLTSLLIFLNKTKKEKK